MKSSSDPIVTRYSPSELDEWAGRIRGGLANGDVHAYLNNVWEGFAIRNALALREQIGFRLTARS